MKNYRSKPKKSIYKYNISSRFSNQFRFIKDSVISKISNSRINEIYQKSPLSAYKLDYSVVWSQTNNELINKFYEETGRNNDNNLTIDEYLDFIKITFTFSNLPIQIFDDEIKLLNDRFDENNLAYQFIDDKIIDRTTNYLYTNITQPVIDLFLMDSTFNNAKKEFECAHGFYLKQNYSHSIIECRKAFESTMKIICDEKQWQYDKSKSTAKILIDICNKNNLFPSYLNNQMSALHSLLLILEGVNTPSNKPGAAHGQGKNLQTIDKELASFTLHMTATAIHYFYKLYKK